MNGPARAEDGTHRCCCIWLDMIDPDSPYFVGADADARCHERGLPADIPFCPECEDRHAGRHRRVGAALPNGAVMLPDQAPGLASQVDP